MALDDVLDEDTTPAVVEPTAAPTPVVEPAPVVDAPQAAKPPSEPEEVGNTDKERAFLAKANDEKRKRQGLEKERDESKAQSAARETYWQQEQQRWQNAQPKPAQPAPEVTKEFWEDPEGSFKAFEAKMQAREDKMAAREVTTQLNAVEKVARAKYGDAAFDTNLAAFKQVMETTPGVHAEWIKSPDQAEYAYNLGASTLAYRQAKDMPTLIEQARAQGRLDAEADFKQSAEDRQRKLDAIPGSLTDVRSTGSNKVVWSGAPSLDDILE